MRGIGFFRETRWDREETVSSLLERFQGQAFPKKTRKARRCRPSSSGDMGKKKDAILHQNVVLEIGVRATKQII
jgi:hypothetical protein